MRLLLVCTALLVLAASACSLGDDEGDDPVAIVGSRTITERDVEGALEHFREEAEREGRDFPEDDAPRFGRVRRQVVSLLVYRAQIEEGARRLGVRVSEEEVERRAKRVGESEGEEEGEGEEGEEYVRDTIRSQLAYVAAYRKVTRNVVVGDRAVERFYRRNRARYGGRPLSAVRATIAAELLQVKRNQAMERWLSRTRAQLQPRYEDAGE